MNTHHLTNQARFIVGTRSQSGYILILSSIFLFVLIASSAHFFYRTTENTTMSGTSRDSTQALLLAESAMEHLRGQMVLNRLNTDNTTRVFRVGGTGTFRNNQIKPLADDFVFFITE